MLVAEPGFKWDAFTGANANLGLFGTRKLIDLRIPSGKPGLDGAKALEFSAGTLGPDQILLITLPRIDRATQSSAWFSALASAGVAIAVYPLGRDELPRWIAARLARQQQRARSDTLAFLADRCEGNLFAARQEIEKLGLLLAEGELDHEAVLHAVADVARFDVYQLSEAWLSGDATRVVKIIAALKAEGEGVPFLLWQLGEDIRAVASVLEATAAGMPLATAVRNVRVWGNYLDNTATGVSATPVAIGPIYIFRNVYNRSRERAQRNRPAAGGYVSKLCREHGRRLDAPDLR